VIVVYIYFIAMDKWTQNCLWSRYTTAIAAAERSTFCSAFQQ